MDELPNIATVLNCERLIESQLGRASAHGGRGSMPLSPASSSTGSPGRQSNQRKSAEKGGDDDDQPFQEEGKHLGTGLFAFLEFQRRGIDAVTLARRRGAIGE